MITIVRQNEQVELWLGTPYEQESDILGSFHYSYCKELIAALKRFEQSEGRN